MDIKEQILVALGLNKEETVKLEWQAKSEDGTIFVSTAEELEAGVDISVLTEDGTTILLPVGTYKTDTGVSFRVEEEGIVAEVIESETEEEVEAGYDDEKEEMTEEVKEEELAEAVEFAFPETDAEKADWAKSYEEMKDKVDNLMDAIADIKERLGEGDTEVEEMAEEVVEPTTNPKSIKTTEVVEFSAEDELTKLKEENERLKTELAAQPASAPLDTNKFSSDRKPMARNEYNKLSRREKFLHDLNK
tara:strand:+ start:590 stop:1333 length:744 start_codon:yes stop_codon:yes gene_type:complete